jgi:hypothetical protein
VTDRVGPEVADGEPLAGEIVGVVDESAHQAAGGVYYVVGAAVVLQATDAVDRLRALVAHRSNAIHWSREGPEMRDRLIGVLADVVVSAKVRWAPAGRRGQLALRSELLSSIAVWADGEGIDHLMIESGDESINLRDRQVLARLARHRCEPFGFQYDHRTKAEPLLWLADALAGAVGEHLAAKNSSAYERLVELGLIEPV